MVGKEKAQTSTRVESYSEEYFSFRPWGLSLVLFAVLKTVWSLTAIVGLSTTN
jgi:hypothetical protein